jgi:hypothetical protein
MSLPSWRVKTSQSAKRMTCLGRFLLLAGPSPSDIPARLSSSIMQAVSFDPFGLPVLQDSSHSPRSPKTEMPTFATRY